MLSSDAMTLDAMSLHLALWHCRVMTSQVIGKSLPTRLELPLQAATAAL
jgi:hypothetical protein